MFCNGVERGWITMRAIKLDFVSSNAPSLAGLGVLALALIFIATGWPYYNAVNERMRTIDKQIQQLKNESGFKEPSKQVQKKSSAELLVKMEDARKLADFLLIPWGDVFSALEAVSLEDLALLSIEPDSKKRQLKITAEAKDKDVMFDYIKRLDATSELSDVYLLKHEIMEDVDQHPIRFVVVAKWKEKS
jgi:hypothetical protein